MTTAANGAAIEVRHPAAAMTPFAPQGLEQAMHLADTLAKSNLLPTPLRNKPADVLVTLITGHELGLSPMQAVRGLHVIEGKAVMSADLTVALVMKRREVCEFFRLAQSSDSKAVYTTKRVGSEPVTLEWTIEQARTAGLASKQNWKNHPAAMLRARCASALARAVYPDLVLGVYDPDETEEYRPTHAVTAPPPANGATVDAEFSPSTPEAAPDEVPRPGAEDAPQADPSDPLAGLRAALAAAATRADLNKVLKQIREVPAELKAEAAALYNARAKEIGTG
jgi:hypothetical protein